MPGLTNSAPARRCRIFVSYAHEDALPPKHQPLGQSLLARFQLELRNLCKTLADDGKVLHDDEIFIDTERLKTAPAWRPAIERAVKDCELLIFLVSPDSKGSDFCIQKELRPVAKRQPQGLIVPVLLRETADWHKLDLGGDRPLGDFHSAGLPKNDKGNAMAINTNAWGSEDMAWRRMTEDLTQFIAENLFAPGSKAPSSRATAPDNNTHLPVTYFCDQLHATNQFQDVLFGAEPQTTANALLVIVQGHYDDNPDMFVNRLHAHHLSTRLQDLGLRVDPYRRPMYWPTQSNAEGDFVGKCAVRQLFEALDSGLPARLARCKRMGDASAVLSEYLAKQDTKACVVFALLPDRSVRTVAALRALSACVDGCEPAGNEMAKLTLFCVDEQAGSRAAWKSLLPLAKRLQAVALDPLQPFDENELRQWHVRYGLEACWSRSDCLAFFHQTARSLQGSQDTERAPGSESPPTQPAARRPRAVKLRLREWADAVRQRYRHIHAICPPAPPSNAPN